MYGKWINKSLLAAIIAFSLPIAGAASDIIRPVKLVRAEDASAATTRTFFGRVSARQTTELAFQVPGEIVKLPIIEGKIIPKGDLIAQLDLEIFQLAVENARLQKDQAARAVDRYAKLSKENAVSRVAYDDALTDLNLAELALKRAQYDLEHATLTAPYDALVAERLVDNHTTIAQGVPIVRIHDMSELRVNFDVPEVLFQQAGRNPDIDFSVKFAASDKAIPAEIREFNAQTPAIGQTFQLTLGLQQPKDLQLLPGSTATVSVTLHDAKQNVIAVPATALISQGGETSAVMVFERDNEKGDLGTVHRVPVQLEAMADGRLRVLDGLKPGEEVVAMGASELKDGQKVRRFQGF